MSNSRFNTYDLGVQEISREMWNDLFPYIDGIFLFVGSFDEKRFHESKNGLENILDKIYNFPFAIQGNKIYKSNAAP